MSRTLILDRLFPSHPRAPAEPVARGLVPRLVPATPANPIIPALGAIQERHGRRNRPGHLNPSQTSINSCRIIASRILCKTNVSAYQHLAGR